MKVLHVIPSLVKGGAERIALDIYQELLKSEEHEVRMVYFRSTNDYEYITKELNVEKIELSYQLSLMSKSKGNIEALQRIVDDFQPDVIHSHLFESEIMLSQLKNFEGKHIVHFHDNMRQLKKWQGKFSKKYLTEWYERNKVLNSYNKRHVEFIGISKDTLAYIHENMPHHFKSHFLLNAINLERFKEPKNNQRKELTAVIIGSLVDKKNQELAIKTIKELHNKGFPFHLYILGDGINRPKLEALREDLGLTSDIHFEGNVDYPEYYLHQATVYLHTASYEPFGLVMLEAMAAGIPIVCTDGKGNRDIIENNANGFIDTTFNPMVLAELIINLLSNQSKRDEMVENAKRYCQKYDIKEYVKRLIEIYKY